MRYVGIDLAWGQRNRSGLAVLDEGGRLLDLADPHTDADILSRVTPHTAETCLVALDAPLIVTNPTGRRACEAALTRDFARFHAGTHPSNTARAEFADGGRALRLARTLGLTTDPHAAAPRRAIEVYPHPATIVLFALPATIRYKHKPGRTLDLLRAETLRLVGCLESLAEADPPLHLREHSRWAAVRSSVAVATRKADLRRVEDMLDAVLCAYIALFADQRPTDVTVYGADPSQPGPTDGGVIVTPSLALLGDQSSRPGS